MRRLRTPKSNGYEALRVLSRTVNSGRLNMRFHFRVPLFTFGLDVYTAGSLTNSQVPDALSRAFSANQPGRIGKHRVIPGFCPE
jgi:hypothetical protein